jgi:hypothetical protein
MSKKIVLITTEHWFQDHDCSAQGELWNILLYLVEIYAPQVILEEWKLDDSETLGRKIANAKLSGAWRSISPPRELKLNWPVDPEHDGRGYRNLDGLTLLEYGPIKLQTDREKYMIERIQEETRESKTGLVIAGLAHHQSLAEKLTNLGYVVEAFCWVRPSPNVIPEFVSSDWNWRLAGEFLPHEPEDTSSTRN